MPPRRRRRKVGEPDSPVHKRTRPQRQRDLVDISVMYRKEKSHVEIRDWLNLNRPYKLSRQQISYDIDEIIEQWRQEFTDEVNVRQLEQLKKIDLIEREAWDAWEKSKGEITKVTQEQEELPKTVHGGPRDGEPAKRTRATVTKEVSHGDVDYLHVTQWCVRARCEILGLRGVAKLELSGPDGGPIALQDGNAKPDMEQVRSFLQELAKEQASEPTPSSKAKG